MDTLIEWLGKADDLSIQYDAGILKNQMLPGIIDLEENLPAIIYPNTENIRDVADVVWDSEVSKADRLDYIMAVCSGTIAGLVDVFFVGELSLDRANKWGTEEVNKFVTKVAKMQGYKGNDLSDAIKFRPCSRSVYARVWWWSATPSSGFFTSFQPGRPALLYVYAI